MTDLRSGCREVELREIAAASHLLPLQCPEELARIVADFVRRLPRR
jgi:hypothetical protein